MNLLNLIIADDHVINLDKMTDAVFVPGSLEEVQTLTLHLQASGASSGNVVRLSGVVAARVYQLLVDRAQYRVQGTRMNGTK